MIFVVSEQLSTLSLSTSALRARLDREVIAVDNGFMATRIIDLNPVHTVVLDLGGLSVAWLRAFADACPDVRCLAIGRGKLDHRDLATMLPANTSFVAEPVDWDEVARRIETAIVEAPHDGESIAASGLDGPLTLLSMSNKDAEIVVSAGGSVGRMLVSAGSIIAAECDTESGEEAAYAMMMWPSPYVRTLPLRESEARVDMSLPLSTLLHESARRSDEISRLHEDRTVAAIVNGLRDVPGFLAATLVHLDTGSQLASCGPGEAIADAARTALASARAWAGEVTPLREGQTRGSLSWSDSAVAASVRVYHRFALAVLSSEVLHADGLLDATNRAGSELTELMESSIAGAAASSAHALPW